jgi:hypothetical protein
MKPTKLSRAGRFAAIVTLMTLPGVVSACPACYGKPDSAIADGMNLAILFLIGVVGLVMGGILGFFFYLRKMAKLDAMRTPQFEEIAKSHQPVRHTPAWHMAHSHHASGNPEPAGVAGGSPGPLRHAGRGNRPSGDTRVS